MAVLRHLITAVVVIATFAAHSEVPRSTRVEPGNLSIKKRFLFLIEATQTNNTICFSVAVAPNASAASPPVEAYLMLFDGHGEIVRQPLEALHGSGEAYRYEFEVASNFLAHSQFVLRELGKGSVGSRGAGDSFWFFLKDFATPNPPNKRSASNGSTAPGLLVGPAKDISAIDYAHESDGVLHHGMITLIDGKVGVTWTVGDGKGKKSQDIAMIAMTESEFKRIWIP